MSEKSTVITFDTEEQKTFINKEIPIHVLVPEDSPILKEVMPEYDFNNQEIGDFKTAEELASILVETCKEHKGHGLSANQKVLMSFSSGTGVYGYYTISSVTTNTFTYTAGTSLTTSGNCSFYPSEVTTSAACTITNSGTISNTGTVTGTSIKYFFDIPTSNLNGAAGAANSFNEAGLMFFDSSNNQYMFSYKTFPLKPKDTSTRLQITWEIMF